ncbi:MAG: hypothetical protein DWQ30_09795 [Acidobacteria bacterium]|nr:MAG: hypothetical protein DWQ30_09795 [Acidobacteriota bacterium]
MSSPSTCAELGAGDRWRRYSSGTHLSIPFLAIGHRVARRAPDQDARYMFRSRCHRTDLPSRIPRHPWRHLGWRYAAAASSLVQSSRLLSCLMVTVLLGASAASAAPLVGNGSERGGKGRARAAQAADRSRSEAGPLRVFLDCDDGCDQRHLRQEIDYLDHVRDPGDAEVHVLVTRTRSSAGWQMRFEFLGRGEFAGRDLVLTRSLSDTDTDEERRQAVASSFQLGLVPYLLQTPAAEFLEVRFNRPSEVPVAAQAVADPWNSWIYRARLEVDAAGEDRRDSQSMSGSISASRTTDDWRLGLGVSQWYRESNFTFEDGERLEETQRDFSIGGSAVKTLGEHWGVGAGASTRRSTFLNLAPSYRLASAVQYNLFPYSESSRHELTFTYFVGLSQLEYEEETIAGEFNETRPDQGVLVSFDIARPWGESGLDVDLSHFLDDLDLYSVRVGGSIDYRIARGLSVRFSGRYSLVRDQIYLPASEATDEEILLGQRALRTDSRYRLGLGLSYTFGSIFNNVVNARLTGSSGGFHRLF